MSFSSGLILTDLNDFIAPSQACTKPVEIKKAAVPGAAAREISIDEMGDYYEEGFPEKLETAKITLNDCLACSGCITSAESVLITMQSHHELKKVLIEKEQSIMEGNESMIIAVSLSPQARASLAAKYNLTLQQTHQKLNALLKTWGVDFLFDTAFSRDLSLIESAKEFVIRYKKSEAAKSNKDTLPMLSGVCPGWVCYAEKTHGYLVPLIDTSKSPQQVIGSIVKHYFAKKMNTSPARIYHVTVMPCYDKKLEASRDDFYDADYQCKDIDCVITTGELELLIKEKNVDFETYSELLVDKLFTKCALIDTTEISLLGSHGSSSGGYIDFILKYAAEALFGISLSDDELEYGSQRLQIKAGKNQDFLEYILMDTSLNEPKELLRFAKAYGFRNIQNLVRKLKINTRKPIGNASLNKSSATRTNSDYHFIEVMACPSGCINGGGQLKPENGMKWNASDSVSTNEVTKGWVRRAEGIYRSLKVLQGPFENSDVMSLYNEWLCGIDSELAHSILHTQYHAIEKREFNGLTENW